MEQNCGNKKKNQPTIGRKKQNHYQCMNLFKRQLIIISKLKKQNGEHEKKRKTNQSIQKTEAECLFRASSKWKKTISSRCIN